MTGLTDIDEIIDNRRLALLVHVVRLSANTLAYQALNLSAFT